MGPDASGSAERVRKDTCGLCLSTLPKDQLRERGGDLLCPPCYEMAEKRSRPASAPASPAAPTPGEGEASPAAPRTAPALDPDLERNLRTKLDWLKQRLQVRPDNVNTIAELVDVYQRLGKESQAALCRRQLESLDPGHPILRKETGTVPEPPPVRKEPAVGPGAPSGPSGPAVRERPPVARVDSGAGAGMAPGRRDPGAREAPAQRDVPGGPPGRREPGVAEREAPEAEAAPVAPFWNDIAGFLGYAFVGRGGAMFLVGGLCFGLARGIARMSVFGGPLAIGGMILSLMVAGYLTSYWFRVISAAAGGSREPPDWPELTDFWNTFISPLFTVLVLGIVPFGPFFILLFVEPSTTVAILQIVAALWGILVMPMVLLIYSMFNSISDAMNPGLLVSSIKKVLPDYLILFITLSILHAIYSFVGDLLMLSGLLVGMTSIILGIFIYSLATSYLQLYFFTTGSFLIGHLYQQGRGRLAWFGEATDPPRPVSSAIVRAVAVGVAAVLVLGLGGALLSGVSGSKAEMFSPEDGLILKYTVRYKPQGRRFTEDYSVRYEFTKVPEGFRVTGTGEGQPVPFTEFTIDPEGNFIGAAPEREDPLPRYLQRGPEGRYRGQSILFGPVSVDVGDAYRNDYPVLEKKMWQGQSCLAVRDPYVNGRLYYDAGMGLLIGIDRSREGGGLPMCYISGVRRPSP